MADLTTQEHDQTINMHPARQAWLESHPYMEAYEKLLIEHCEMEPDDDLENFHFCFVRDLDLAWAAAKAVFGDQATPDIAWKIHITTQKEMSAMWKWKNKKEEEEKKKVLENESSS